jgi:hypothetical protein
MVAFIKQTKRVRNFKDEDFCVNIDYFYRLIANTLQLMSLKKLCLSSPNTIHLPKERTDQLILLKLEQPTLANGLADLEMGLVFRFGLMALAMKDNGKIIELTAMENLCM